MISRVFGLTGGIASGKTTVAAMFQELGAGVVNADAIAKEIILPGKVAYSDLLKAFGKEILLQNTSQQDPEIDRDKLAQLVFNSSEKLEKLNLITHPEIIKESTQKISELLRQKYPVILYEAPLLCETGRDRDFEGLIVVDVPTQVQKDRARKRGLSEEQLEARMNAQVSRERRIDAATWIIDNSGSLEKTKAQVKALWEQWLPTP